MATDTAPTPARHLWQWPTFFAGLAAFALARAGAVPVGPPDPAAHFRTDVAALRTAADARTVDAAGLKALVGPLAATADQFPDAAPAAHFALGSAYVRVAEQTPDAGPARDAYALAAQHFALVRPDQLDPADGPRLTFRLAKAKTGVGLPPLTPPGVVNGFFDQLTMVPAGEVSGDANRLAADLALRLAPPNVKRAKDLLTAYLTDAGLGVPAASLARAKLRLSEVLLMGTDTDAARKWLAQIGPDAPPDVLAPAKAQLARILMADGRVDDAAKEWTAVRAIPAVPVGLKTAAAYHLGRCRQLTRQPDAAAKLYEEAAKGDGPEAAAAVVRLADLALQSPDVSAHAAAAARLATAVKGAGWTNPLVPLPDVRATFETAADKLQADGAFDAADKLLDTYTKVAADGRAKERRAGLLAGWADAARRTGADGKTRTRAAAEAYATLAADRPPAARAEFLRRAADLYRQAEDPTAAAALLDQLIGLPNLPDDAAGQVWADYAEVLTAAEEPAKALVAFNRAMATSGPAAAAARYKLAHLLLDGGEARKAPLGWDLLRQIADSSAAGPADRDVQEKAFVELGQDALKGGRYAEAEGWFGKQLNAAPNGSEAGLAKFLFGVCLLQRAAPKPDGTAAPDATESREKALKLFAELGAELDAKERDKSSLSERDGWLRTQAALRVLQAYQQMDRPNDVVFHAATLLPRVRGQVEELIVLSMMYHAHKGRPELALEVHDQMKQAFGKLPDGAFKGGGGEYSKEYWEKTWFSPAADAAP